MSCGLITIGGVAPACDAIPPSGTRARVIVINHSELDGPPTESGGRITAIDLIPGAVAYEFTGFRNDAKKSDEVINPGIGANQFKHAAGWVIYERTQVQKNNIEQLARGTFLVLIENKGQDADAWEVIGKEVGVEIVPGVIRNAHENGGFFILNFSTPEGEFEPKLPQSLGTDYANANSIVEALLGS